MSTDIPGPLARRLFNLMAAVSGVGLLSVILAAGRPASEIVAFVVTFCVGVALVNLGAWVLIRRSTRARTEVALRLFEPRRPDDPREG